MQIKIQDLLPLLRDGYVAMDEDGAWRWFECPPTLLNTIWYQITYVHLNKSFDIAPFEGDWKDSCMKCGGGK